MNYFKNPIVWGILLLLVIAAVVTCVLLIMNNKKDDYENPNGIRFKKTLSKINIPFLSIFYPNQTTLNSSQINSIYINNKNFIDTNFNEKTSKYLLQVNSKNCLEDKLLILILTNLKPIIKNIVQWDTNTSGHKSFIKGIMVFTLMILIYIKSKNSPSTYTLQDFCTIIACGGNKTVWSMKNHPDKHISKTDMINLLTNKNTYFKGPLKPVIFDGSGDDVSKFTITNHPYRNALNFMHLFNHFVFLNHNNVNSQILNPILSEIDKLIISIQNSSNFINCNLSNNNSIDAQNALKLENIILLSIKLNIMPGPYIPPAP